MSPSAKRPCYAEPRESAGVWEHQDPASMAHCPHAIAPNYTFVDAIILNTIVVKCNTEMASQDTDVTTHAILSSTQPGERCIA